MKSFCDQSLFLIALLALSVTSASSTFAQATRAALRDPTQPPAVIASPAGVVRSPVDTFRPDHLVTVGGVRYVVWNSRRYAVGETIQGARIERILDTAVWLRGSEGLRKMPLFAGIEKRPPHSAAPIIKMSPERTSMDRKNGTAK